MLAFSVYKQGKKRQGSPCTLGEKKRQGQGSPPARRAACWESENDLKIIEEPPTTSLTDDD